MIPSPESAGDGVSQLGGVTVTPVAGAVGGTAVQWHIQSYYHSMNASDMMMPVLAHWQLQFNLKPEAESVVQSRPTRSPSRLCDHWRCPVALPWPATAAMRQALTQTDI